MQGDLADDNDDEQVFGSEQMVEYSTDTNVMQWVLSAHVDLSEKLQRHNLFQIFFVIKDCRVRTIIDGGSCNNLVSADFVTKIGLMTLAHTHTFSGSTIVVRPRSLIQHASTFLLVLIMIMPIVML
jgi:hypothetical protein